MTTKVIITGDSSNAVKAVERLRKSRMALRRRYKIQDVIRRRQVLLVQGPVRQRQRQASAGRRFAQPSYIITHEEKNGPFRCKIYGASCHGRPVLCRVRRLFFWRDRRERSFVNSCRSSDLAAMRLFV